ncbi:MAG TPA: nicotinate-nucleotide diphosphorylase (carboxylating), partial [Roseiarcus sp.]
MLEDLGRAGDLTTDAIVPRDFKTKTVMAAREEGVVAGLDLAALAFHLIDPTIRFQPMIEDGAAVAPGARLAIVEGR